MRRFAMAADYMRTNGFTTPLFSFSLASILWQWFPAWQVFSWAAATSLAQMTLGVVSHFALKASNDPLRWRAWRRRLIACSIVSGCAFGGAIIAFYLPGERLNNILMVAVGVGSLATLAPMNAPDRLVMAVATAPFIVILCMVMGLYEAYPFNLILVAMAALYCVETLVTANKHSAMVGDMIGLQIRNGALISSLADEKAESDRARVRAERANRAKSNFLANMSHELRTPLNAILGFSEIIRDRTFGESASARYAAYASDIHNSGQHLLKLIAEILDLSRIEAEKLELTDECVAIRDAFADVLKLNGAQAKSKGLELASECADGLALVADRKALVQILVNLASNAIKFTPPGGAIAIRAFRKNGETVLEVEDTGIGIAPGEIDRIFERFGQARHDVAAAEAGVGLGLPIVKGLAEAHGGGVSVTSQLGRGTCVRVWFPSERISPVERQAA